MRTLLTGLLLVLGCDDATPGGADLAATTPDLSGASQDLGGPGASCNSACDCMPGLGCNNMVCEAAFAPVYCCTSATCPSGAVCQNADQSYGQCPSTSTDGGTPIVDGGGVPLDMSRPDGGFDYCPYIKCMGGGMAKCVMFGCAMCVAQGNNMVCAR